MDGTTPPPPPRGPTDARQVARRQLRAVLIVLGVLDFATLTFLLVLFLERAAWGLSNLELFLAIVAGAAFVTLTRIGLAVRLRNRRGNLF